MELAGIKNFLGGFFGQGQGPGAVNKTAPLAAGTQAAAAGPLAPAFDPKTCANQADINAAIREAKWLVKNYKASMGNFAFVNADAEATFHGYETGKAQSAEISAPLPQNRLDLVVVVNVSGHDFKDRPDKAELLAARAKNNRYVIRVTHPDGRTETMKDIVANGATFNVQGISVQNVKPGKLVLEVWPEGSAQVGGYMEGRRLEIDYRPATSQRPR